jgi:nitrite reductase/ring-hydroxylating ferredoxin subunit
MAAQERLICDSSALEEGGKGVRFELAPEAAPGVPSHPAFVTTGFAIRFHGEVHGYVNRCPHMGTELDWEPGEFFEEARIYLVCSTHGALFEPASGRCVAGPCRGASLQRVRMRERDGQVFLQATLEEDTPNDKGES